jgi:hypothetical protein
MGDNDRMIGRVMDVKEVETQIRHKLLPRNALPRRLIPFFKFFMSAQKDKFCQWYIVFMP